MALFKKRIKPTEVTSLAQLRDLTSSGKPVLIDMYQVDCPPCQVMGSIMNELADEYADRVHVVKVDVQRVSEIATMYKVMSTPAFVLLAPPSPKRAAKARKKAERTKQTVALSDPLVPRWRANGLIKKDQLQSLLDRNIHA